MSVDKPQFGMTCIKSDYPQHLVPGVKYKVDPWETALNRITGKKEVNIHWADPMSPPGQINWLFIGYFPIDCFNPAPIQKWMRAKKGLSPEQPVRTRPAAPVQRTRPQVIVRQRPTVIIQRTRPGG